jgi:hypothetical protein
LALRGKKIGFDKASVGAPLAELSSGIELFSPQGIHFSKLEKLEFNVK